MQICLITPAPGRSRGGNRVTALRWARILRGLGHHVTIDQEYRGRPCDLLVALHARRSFRSIERFRRQHPDRPLVLTLTGTDLYCDLRTDPQARQALGLASRLIVLQPMGIEELPEHVRAKTSVIYQSASRAPEARPPKTDVFEICVLSHLRPVKDPLRAAAAARLLPPSSRVQIVHAGAALSPEMGEAARAEMASNPRYRWLGELPRWKALRVLARSRALVLSSTMEGGANVVSEAIAAGVPVLASRISGSIGLLGPKYRGYFPVGDTQALADLLSRAETDAIFYEAMKTWCMSLRPLIDATRERESWTRLLHDVSVAEREISAGT